MKGRPRAGWPSLKFHAKLCNYAAADAWLTLEIFDAMRKRSPKLAESSARPCSTAGSGLEACRHACPQDGPTVGPKESATGSSAAAGSQQRLGALSSTPGNSRPLPQRQKKKLKRQMRENAKKGRGDRGAGSAAAAE